MRIVMIFCAHRFLSVSSSSHSLFYQRGQCLMVICNRAVIEMKMQLYTTHYVVSHNHTTYTLCGVPPLHNLHVLFMPSGGGGRRAVPDCRRRHDNCRAPTQRLHSRRRQWTAHPTTVRQTRTIQAHRGGHHNETYSQTGSQTYRDLELGDRGWLGPEWLMVFLFVCFLSVLCMIIWITR